MALFIANLLSLEGTTISVNVGEVAALSPVPSSLLPSGIPAGTYLDFLDGGTERKAVQGTVAAVAAGLSTASSGAFVFASLVSLDGTTIALASAEVAALTPVPVELLPSGVPNGTRVLLEDGAAFNVSGTVAATVAALQAAQSQVSSVAARVNFGWDGLAVVLASALNILSVTRSAVGLFLITTTEPIGPGGAVMPSIVASSNQGPAALIPALVVDVRQATPTTFDVQVFDVNGVLADPANVSVVIFPTEPV